MTQVSEQICHNLTEFIRRCDFHHCQKPQIMHRVDEWWISYFLKHLFIALYQVWSGSGEDITNFITGAPIRGQWRNAHFSPSPCNNHKCIITMSQKSQRHKAVWAKLWRQLDGAMFNFENTATVRQTCVSFSPSPSKLKHAAHLSCRTPCFIYQTLMMMTVWRSETLGE